MSRVLVISHDPVRKSMSGPAIRSFELTRQLHLAGHEVVLAVPFSTDLGPQPFQVKSWRPDLYGGLKELSKEKDVVVLQGFILEHNMGLRNSEAKIVVDLYDPFHLEYIASHAYDPEALGMPEWKWVLTGMLDQVRVGDFFLCASERQRDFWLGMLSGLNRVSPATYATDPTLRNLIDLVPFGIPSDPPVKQAKRMRGVIPGIEEDDFVLLWGGGVYNWLDPLTPIKAVARVATTHPQTKLLFLATRHPNPDIPEMEIINAAVRLAEDLGVLDKHVFFSQNWVPYAERSDWLLESDVGLSTHREHLETRFSFRTRILDCFWTGLPVLCTKGDSLADEIERYGLGRTVDPEDEDGLCEAIIAMLEDKAGRQEQSARIKQHAQRFTWQCAAQPLIKYCNNPYPAADRRSLARRTDSVPVPLRSNHQRAFLGSWVPPASWRIPPLPLRIARVMLKEGPVGVASRVRRRFSNRENPENL